MAFLERVSLHQGWLLRGVPQVEGEGAEINVGSGGNLLLLLERTIT